MPHRRLRTFTLWTGTLLSLLIAAAFVVSGWWWVIFPVLTPFGLVLVWIEAGAISVEWGNRRGTCRVGTHGSVAGYVELPLYVVLAAVAVPTRLVWRLGRKHVEPGHCRCGYDLTGNVSGKCPECGRRVKTQINVVARRLNVTANDANPDQVASA